MKNYPKYVKQLKYNTSKTTHVYLTVLHTLRLVNTPNHLYYKTALKRLDTIAPLIRKFVRKNKEAEIVLYYLWHKHKEYVTRTWEVELIALLGEMFDIWFIEERLLIDQDIRAGRSYYIVGPKWSIIMAVKIYRYIVNTYDISMAGIRKRIKSRNSVNRAKRRKGRKHNKIVSIGEYASNHKKVLLDNLSKKMTELLHISKEYGERPNYFPEMEKLAKKKIKLAYNKPRGIHAGKEIENPGIVNVFGRGTHKILKYEPKRYKRAFSGSSKKK